MPKIQNLSKVQTDNLGEWSDFADRVNELHKFNTYDYHHILIVSNTTEVTDKLYAAQNMDLFTYGSADERWDVKIIPGSESSGKYMMLVNGMIDSDYVISELVWESMFDINAKVS